jgi:hypothetical protein
MSATINLDIAKRVDIVCRKGDTATFSITITDSAGEASDLNGYTFDMEVRESDTQVNAEGGDNTSALVLSSGSGISALDNVITITASATDTETMSGLYVYDLQATDGSSNVSTWLYGTFKVNEDVTI